ncbi:MAG: GNAT family N-acetyltransferase [Planctomycetaceae bacterium]|nr:GNAT family N-acetyltransferase [Planctomycetaceae bacterium]
MSKESGVVIRSVREDDIPAVVGLIHEFADYMQLDEPLTITAQALKFALFEKRQGEAIVAEVDGELVGYAYFFQTLGTFSGRQGLFMEDLFVSGKCRRGGIGQAIMARLATIALERDCDHLEWGCRDWNHKAIAFYLKQGASVVPEKSTYRLDQAGLRRLGAV